MLKTQLTKKNMVLSMIALASFSPTVFADQGINPKKVPLNFGAQSSSAKRSYRTSVAAQRSTPARTEAHSGVVKQSKNFASVAEMAADRLARKKNTQQVSNAPVRVQNGVAATVGKDHGNKRTIVRPTLSRPIPAASPSNSSSHPSFSLFYLFPNVKTAAEKADLNQKLKNIHSTPEFTLSIADSKQFKSTSQCSNPRNTCVIVPQKVLSTFTSNLASLGTASSIGMQAAKARPTLKQNVVKPADGSLNFLNPAARNGGGNSTLGYPSSYGTSYMGYTNPDYTVYFIPDNYPYQTGFYQEASAWLDPITANAISPTAGITNVSYDINIYHTYHRDLIVDVGYDASTLGGSIQQDNMVVNRPLGISAGYHTYFYSTHTMDGLHPDALYYVDGYDVAFGDQGDIEWVDFTVDWIDFANVTFFGTGAFNYFNVNANRFLSVTNTLYNNSEVDTGVPFSIGWYLELDLSAAQNCSALTYNPSNQYVWLADYANLSPLNANSTVQVSSLNLDMDLIPANGAGNYMYSGNYCLWAYADDLDNVWEWDESTIVAWTNAWDNIYNMGGFTYVYQSYNADLTFDYGSGSNNYFANNGTLNASAMLYNFSPSSTSASASSFDIGWYVSAKPVGGCSNLVLNANTAFFVGYTTQSNLGGFQSQYVSLPPTFGNLNYAQTAGGVYLYTQPQGDYCLWAWVDDTGFVTEGDESNNVLIYPNAFYYQSTVGINEVAASPTMSLYPSVATTEVNITLSEALQTEKVQIRVQNLAGQSVIERGNEIVGSKATVDVSSLAQGTYILSVQAKDKLISQRFIKQ